MTINYFGCGYHGAKLDAMVSDWLSYAMRVLSYAFGLIDAGLEHRMCVDSHDGPGSSNTEVDGTPLH